MKLKNFTSENDKIIGDNIRKLRALCGISQFDMARYLEVSYQQVQKYEKGINRVSAERLFRLRHLFGVSYEQFYQGVSIDNDRRIVSTKEHRRADQMLQDKMDALSSLTLKHKALRIIDILVDNSR